MFQARRAALVVLLALLVSSCSRDDPTGGTLSKYLSTDKCMDRLALVANPDHAKSFMAKEYAQRASCTQEYKKIEAVGCDALQDGGSCRARYQPTDSIQWSHWIEMKKRNGQLMVDWFSATGFNPDSLEKIFEAPAGKAFPVRALVSFSEDVDDMVKVTTVHPWDATKQVDIAVQASDAVHAMVPKEGPALEASLVLASREKRPPVIIKISRGWGFTE